MDLSSVFSSSTHKISSYLGRYTRISTPNFGGDQMHTLTKTGTIGWLLSALVACSPATSPQEPSALSAGCYTLTLGSWSKPGETGILPVAFQLTNQSKVLPLPGQETTWHYVSASWTPAVKDSASIDFSTNYVGARLRVTGTGPSFSGQAETTFSDALPFMPARASATLESIDCPPIP